MWYNGFVDWDTASARAPASMRLRCAVPKIPAKPSVPPTLPLHKGHPRPTPSESTLPQLLIPLHFKSFISNAYKKPQGGGPTSSPKVWQPVTRHAPHLRTHSKPRNPIPFCALLHNFRTPPGGGIATFFHSALVGETLLSVPFNVCPLANRFQQAATRCPSAGLITSLLRYRITSSFPPVDFPPVLVANGHSRFSPHNG